MKHFISSWGIMLLFAVSLSFVFDACKENVPQTSIDPYQHISDPDVKKILIAAIEKSGGLDNWNNKTFLRFKKDFTLHEESGAIEKAVIETHSYQYQPEEEIRISWEQDSLQHQLTYRQGKVEKTVNGRIDKNTNTQSLQNTVLSATYVISIPFKLLDKGVLLTYEGLENLEDGQEVAVIRGEFNPDLHENHSTPDIWWYYFDPSDYKLVAYMVKHADHYSYVKNERFTMVNGFLFPKERKSYRVDEQRNILYLRAAYVYEEMEDEQ